MPRMFRNHDARRLELARRKARPGQIARNAERKTFAQAKAEREADRE